MTPLGGFGAFGVITGIVISKAGALLMARINGQGAVAITQATIASATWNTQDLTAGQSVGSGFLTVSQVLFNALQQGDPSWNKDSALNPGADGQWGYNFAWLQDPALITWQWDTDPNTGEVTPHTYQTDIALVPVSGKKIIVPYRYKPIPTWP